MQSASTSKWRRSVPRLSLRPMPSVPRAYSPPGTHSLICSGSARTLSDDAMHGPVAPSRARDIRDARRLRGVQQVPALAFLRVAAELGVAGEAPDVARDAVLLGENRL